MAISWGSWEYASGNGMRVGIEATVSSVSFSSTSCTVTFKVYTQNQYRYNNPGMDLSMSGTINYPNADFNNDDTGGTILRATRTYTRNFDSNDYGSGAAATATMTATIGNAYNGVTPSKTLSVSIPKRPYAAPTAPTGVTATRVSDSEVTVAWTRTATTGRPYVSQKVERWDNVSNAWTVLTTASATAVSFSDTTTAANRRYRYRVSATNTAGTSAVAVALDLQTTPAGPSGCTVEKTSPTSVLVKWTNGASTTGDYTYGTLIEEKVDGGAWTEIDGAVASVSSYARSGRAPGSVYQYRVRARSELGSTTYSDYATSGTIQLQSPPAAPTVVSTVRTNDNSFTLAWTNNPDGTLAPYDSLTIQRRDTPAGAWNTIATLTSAITTFTDVSTVTNRAYSWRIAANNAAGSSAWVEFTTYQTRPAEPTEVKAKAAPGGAILVSWINNVGYTAYAIKLRYYLNGVLVTDTVAIAAGQTSYLLPGVDLTKNYKFGIKAVSTVGYASESQWADGIEIAAATIPNAPDDLEPSGTVIDLTRAQVLSWAHNPSLDESDQTAFEVRHSADGGSTWVNTGKITSTDQSWTMPANTRINGPDLTWQVRTWGVHATASAYSASAVVSTSTTPTVTLMEPATSSLPISRLDVEWSYGDAESLPQASWEVELYNGVNELLERQNGDGTTSSITMATALVDGGSYTLRLRVTDGDGLQSDWVSQNLLADFMPPAEPVLTADYSQEAGVTILTLTPTPDDGGVTTLPVVGVDVQRRLLNQATGVFGPWETLAEQVSDNATLIDTTAPIADDGEYRVITYSEAPSAVTSDPQPPVGSDDRWVYLSGGPNFTQVCRLMGNVALRTTASRERALYKFAGRKKPVMFAGEARERVIDIAGLLDGESSSPAEWESLIENCDVLLLRDPLGHRVYGSVPQVAIDYLGNEMYAISFTVTEVDFP